MLVANEAEQLVVAAVREYRAAGLSLRTIGERLAERGMLPRKGGAWIPTQIKRIAEAAGWRRILVDGSGNLW